MLHDVIALGIGQRVVGLAQMPLAGEVGLVARLLENGAQGPFRLRQSAALALEGHRRHAAAVRYAPGLDRRTPRRTARLGIEGKERHALVRHPVEVGCGHAASFAAAVDAEITPTGVVGDDQENVGLRRCEGKARGDGHQECDQ